MMSDGENQEGTEMNVEESPTFQPLTEGVTK